MTQSARPLLDRPTSTEVREAPVPGSPNPAILRSVVFLGGAGTMSLEMCASRLLAPYFGTSLYVWAIVIGLIMVYLAAGYFIGGMLADRFPRDHVLFRIVLGSGFFIGLIPLVSRPILQWLVLGFDQLSIGLFLGSLTAVIALFALPVVALGCVSPFAIRLALPRVEQAGNTSGAMYALSTTGSLLGTFLAVFVLIPTIGTRRTLLTTAVVLMVAGLAALGRRSLPYVILVPLIGLQLFWQPGPVRAASGGRLIHEAESAYYYVQVLQHGQERELVLDEGHAIHSVYNPHRLLTGQYWDDMLLAPLFARHFRAPRRIAILGLGAGTVARLYSVAFPRVTMDGVEIDPAVIDAGRRYFHMDEPRLHTYAQDARYFLLVHPRRYDVVTVDAFRQPYIPFQLATREFFALVRSRLSAHGTLVMNVGHTSHDYRLVNAIAATMRRVFPSVIIVDVPGSINSIVVGSRDSGAIRHFHRNIVHAPRLLASVAHRAEVSGRMRPARASGPVFTDDLAPVEQLIDEIVLDYARNGGG